MAAGGTQSISLKRGVEMQTGYNDRVNAIRSDNTLNPWNKIKLLQELDEEFGARKSIANAENDPFLKHLNFKEEQIERLMPGLADAGQIDDGGIADTAIKPSVENPTGATQNMGMPETGLAAGGVQGALAGLNVPASAGSDAQRTNAAQKIQGLVVSNAVKAMQRYVKGAQTQLKATVEAVKAQQNQPTFTRQPDGSYMSNVVAYLGDPDKKGRFVIMPNPIDFLGIKDTTYGYQFIDEKGSVLHDTGDYHYSTLDKVLDGIAYDQTPEEFRKKPKTEICGICR